jgi:hypothetical protein
MARDPQETAQSPAIFCNGFLLFLDEKHSINACQRQHF